MLKRPQPSSARRWTLSTVSASAFDSATLTRWMGGSSSPSGRSQSTSDGRGVVDGSPYSRYDIFRDTQGAPASRRRGDDQDHCGLAAPPLARRQSAGDG